MEVSYSRGLDYQYMVIGVDEEAKEDYRLSMLVNNRISGFLPAYLQQINGKCAISYEITALETLSTYFESKKITYDEMAGLLLILCSAVQEAGRYLLNGEGILLEPEYIYISGNMEKIYFCYYPYKPAPLHQSVNRLSRFLIDHMDCDDRDSLELAYGLFQESLKENLSISAIIGCLKNRLGSGEKNESKGIGAKTEPGTEKRCDNQKRSLSKEYKGTALDENEGRVSEMNPEKEDAKNAGLEKAKKTGQAGSDENTEKAKQTQSTKKTYNEGNCDEKKAGIKQVLETFILAGIITGIFGYVVFSSVTRLIKLGILPGNMLLPITAAFVLAAAATGSAVYAILKKKNRQD